MRSRSLRLLESKLEDVDDIENEKGSDLKALEYWRVVRLLEPEDSTKAKGESKRSLNSLTFLQTRATISKISGKRGDISQLLTKGITCVCAFVC